MCLLIKFYKVNTKKGRWFNGEWQFVDVMFRAILDKGPRTKNIRTNLKQIENWTRPFLTLKKTFKKKVQWMCLKAWGPIWGSNIKKIWLTYERIRLNLLFFFPWFFLISILTSILCTWKDWKCSFFLATTLWGSTKPTMLTLKLIYKKWGSTIRVLSTMPSINKFVFHFS
jgi:hypothetical protein